MHSLIINDIHLINTIGTTVMIRKDLAFDSLLGYNFGDISSVNQCFHLFLKLPPLLLLIFLSELPLDVSVLSVCVSFSTSRLGHWLRNFLNRIKQVWNMDKGFLSAHGNAVIGH